MTITEFLKNHVPFLAGIAEEDAHALAVGAEQLDFPSGQVILMQGVTVDGLHVIASGKVAVWLKRKGKEAMKVAELGPGMVFGETSIIETSVAGATVKAVEDTHVFLIPQDPFLSILERNPGIKERIVSIIAARRAAAQPKPAAEAAPSGPTGTLEAAPVVGSTPAGDTKPS